MDTKLIYVHDPMCSWCWAFRPTLTALVKELPWELTVRRLLGGLAPDSTEPMPTELRIKLQETWRHIQERVPGTQFNFDFWEHCLPRRSTYPACRAVIAARNQDHRREDDMVLAIQRAYYLQARNPSDDTTLVELADELGLDRVRFKADLEDPVTQQHLEAEMADRRAIGGNAFPSLILKTGDSLWPIPVDYRDYGPMKALIAQRLEDDSND